MISFLWWATWWGPDIFIKVRVFTWPCSLEGMCFSFSLAGPGVAGYLTAGTSSSVMSNLPPPVDHEAGDLGFQTWNVRERQWTLKGQSVPSPHSSSWYVEANSYCLSPGFMTVLFLFLWIYFYLGKKSVILIASHYKKALCGSTYVGTQEFFFLMDVSTFCSFVSVYKTVNQTDKTSFLVFIMSFFFFLN